MALHNLKITVIDGGKAETSAFATSSNADTSSKKRSSSGKDSTIYNFFHVNQGLRDKLSQATSPTVVFSIQQGMNLAVQTTRAAINYYVSDIGRANGDSNYQAIVNREMEKVTDALSVGQGFWSGAVAGSAMGIIGVAVGGIIGVASSAINLGFKYAERERAYQHEMFKEQTSQAYQLARANYSALTGRVR